MAKELKSDFAILDVKGGRAALRKRIEAGEKVHVVIRGVIDTVHSHDDGTSIEFSLAVKSAHEVSRA